MASYPPPSAPPAYNAEYPPPSMQYQSQQQGFNPVKIHIQRSATDALQDFATRNELGPNLRASLEKLRRFNISIIADSSGSMNKKLKNDIVNPKTGTYKTRWDELNETLHELLFLITQVDKDGCDVDFLDGRTFENVTVPTQELEDAFLVEPHGRTPLKSTLERVMRRQAAKAKTTGEYKPTLYLIFTDGCPSKDNCVNFEDDSEAVKSLIINRNDKFNNPITFIITTDDDDEVEWLSKWEQDIINTDTDDPNDTKNIYGMQDNKVDCVDDYLSERQEVRKAQGSSFTFTKGMYLVKILLGSTDTKWDKLDECPLSADEFLDIMGRERTQEEKIEAAHCAVLMLAERKARLGFKGGAQAQVQAQPQGSTQLTTRQTTPTNTRIKEHKFNVHYKKNTAQAQYQAVSTSKSTSTPIRSKNGCCVIG